MPRVPRAAIALAVALLCVLGLPAAAFANQVTYDGGDVLTTSHVYAMAFVAPPSTAASLAPLPPYVFAPAAPNLESSIAALDSPDYVGWWTSEYSLPARAQLIAPPTYAGTFFAVSEYLATAPVVSTTAIDAFFASSPQVPAYDPNAVYLIFLRAGQALTSGTAGTQSATDPLCALHNRTPGPDPVHYAVIPYLSMPGCSFTVPGATPDQRLFNRTSLVTDHELIETITDPQTNGVAWVSLGRAITELADACESHPFVPLRYRGFTYAAPSLLSDITGSCTATMPPATATFQQSSAGVVVDLSGPSGPLAGAIVDVVGASSILFTARTSAAGEVTLPSDAVGATFFFAGSPTAGGFFQVIGPAPARAPLRS